MHGHYIQNIKEKSEAQAIENSYSLNEAKKIKNRSFNRYRDVNPYDHSRIILQKNIGTDYINANLVKVIIRLLLKRKYKHSNTPYYLDGKSKKAVYSLSR